MFINCFFFSAASSSYLKRTRILSGLKNHISNAPFRLLFPDKRFLSYSGFEILPVAAMAPVSVVVVYPSLTPAFQQAVVALAEFLQWHGGCRVVIDMWQQGKIAELGPLRWLAEQVQSADRVLIVSPQVETPSSMPGPCTPASSLPRHSIPAATGDLYPLILNMVASHARSATELAKFWVVQLHAEKDKKSCVLPPELQTCRAFCLMKDLNRLCKSLHSQRKVGKKISSLLFKHKILYSQNSTTKLREAIEMLGAKKPGISDGTLNKDLC
uniref:SEFIR domain-containing protein n=1 Tax=Poecilia reticulata TaxID=8081 RepID=A0A3P9MTV1_POERE